MRTWAARASLVLTILATSIILVSCGGGGGSTRAVPSVPAPPTQPQPPAPTATPKATPTPTPTPTPSTSVSFIYEADNYVQSNTAPNGVVNVFAADANGNVAPVRQIFGTSQYSMPDGVAVDRAGNTYVCYSNATGGAVAVYSPSASGAATPTRLLQGSATNMYSCEGVALDGNGNIYELDQTNPNAGAVTNIVNVFANTANGNTAPMRQIVLPASTPLGYGFAVDPNGTIYLAAGNAYAADTIDVFGPSQNGSAVPERTITVGQANSLLRSLGLDPAGNLYAVDTEYDYVYVLSSSASGTATPSRTLTIAGSLWGIAADRNGSIYVGVVPFASGYPPLINVYAPGANGNAMPVQSIGGSNTDIHSTRGLALY